jgi:DNA-binding XRE family transcriptional regulator
MDSLICAATTESTPPSDPSGPEVKFRHERFKLARITQGYTQSTLAAVLGVDGSTISRWEDGKINPLPRHIEKICQLLALSPEDLYLEEK